MLLYYDFFYISVWWIVHLHVPLSLDTYAGAQKGLGHAGIFLSILEGQSHPDKYDFLLHP